MKKSLIFRIAAFLILGFLLVTLIKQQIDLSGKRAQLNALQKEAEEKSLKVEELTNMLKSSDEPGFIENAARQRFGYVYANERVFYDSWGN